MTLFDRLFPSRRHPDFVQTEWATGWMSAASGFGYAAEHLTQQRQGFGATIDQVGLAVFFLQRHRAELALKGLLDAVGAKVPNRHELSFLWKSCESVLATEYKSAWAQFEAEYLKLISALDRVDGSSYVFRYPVDTKGVEVVRPSFIDLDVLNEAVDKFDFGVGGFIDYIDDLKSQAPGP